jgi:hypothetical protein
MTDFTKAKTPVIFIGLLMISSFSYIVALAWNTFFTALTKKYISETNTVLGYFIYAMILSIILTMIAYFYISYYNKK